MPRITGARLLADALAEYGVSQVFLVPTILSRMLVEMDDRTDIGRIVTHGEKAAVYMADGYARATGKPGVCMAQVVGAANLAAGLRDPFLACTPVLAITGGPSAPTRSRQTYQQIDDLPLFERVTKWNAQTGSADRLPDLLRQAFRVATTGKPGPVHLELEGHAGEVPELQETDVEPGVEARFAQVPPFRPEPETESVDQALERLARAERPVIVAGGGVRSSGASPELVALAERLQIPVATSLNAKDTIPGNHPLNVGVVGSYSRRSANQAVVEADLVFFVGSQTGSQVTNSWTVPPLTTPVIQADIEPTELGRHYRNDVSLLGDARATLRLLAGRAGAATTPDRRQWTARVAELVGEWRKDYEPLLASDATPIRPERLCGELSRSLPDDALLMSDTGHSGMWTGGMVDLRAGQGYLRAAGSLGWGFPASIGAKLGAPDRPVVLFSGDGGFWYHLPELETAVRWRVGTVVLVNNNRSLNQEIGPYSAAYGGQLRSRHAELWHFSDVDLAAVAESMGARGIRVTDPGDIEKALTTALDQAQSERLPVVVDAVSDIEALAPRAFS
ncbi:MAG: thiamine pyrophosphate-binding protein [Acidimicrobiales bacterium]|nr:thiamine pyrophosphate-binding protein [Acidimicrobiales bacterium]